MYVGLHNTDKIVQVNGVPARIWEGRTLSGISVVAFITRLAVKRDEDAAEFERDLQETTAPSADVAMWPARMFLD